MIDISDLGTFGRFIETSIAEMSPNTKDAYDFTKGLRGLVPGPHRIWLANPKLSKTIVPTGAYYQTHSTLTKAEIKLVTCLGTAIMFAAVYLLGPKTVRRLETCLCEELVREASFKACWINEFCRI